MQRRHLLAIGSASALLLALGGMGAVWMRPPRPEGRLSTDARELMGAVAVAVLDQVLPAAATARASALNAHLRRLEATIDGLSPHLQAEVEQLMALLISPPGRIVLAGLSTPWASAGPAEVQHGLQAMRSSTLELRQQVFHALRDLTNAAYFADAQTWQAIGYPGPRAV